MQNHVFGHFLSFFCHFLSFFHEKFHCLTSFLGFFQFFWFFFKPENYGPNQTAQKDGQKEPENDKKFPKVPKKCHFWTPKMGYFWKKGVKNGSFLSHCFFYAQKVLGSFYLWKKSGVKKSGDFLVFKKNHLQISRVSIFVTVLIKWH